MAKNSPLNSINAERRWSGPFIKIRLTSENAIFGTRRVSCRRLLATASKRQQTRATKPALYSKPVGDENHLQICRWFSEVSAVLVIGGCLARRRPGGAGRA
jgi:hypothetical protein